MAYYTVSCAPVPQPFLWSTGFDVDDVDVNGELKSLMQLINSVSSDVCNITNIDLLHAKFAEHFEHEEDLLDRLLKLQESLLERYYEAQRSRSWSLSTFCSIEDVNRADTSPQSSDDERVLDLQRKDPMSWHRREPNCDLRRHYDPKFEEEVISWLGTISGEVTRVDLRVCALTKEGIESHKVKHSLFLQDCLIIRSRILEASQKDQLALDNYTAVGAAEIAFIKNWLTQHIKSDDMSIRYSKMLIRRVQALLVCKTDLTRMIQASNISSDGRHDEWLGREPLIRGESLKPELTQAFSQALCVTTDPQITSARAWLGLIQEACVCSLLVLRPPSGSKREIRTVLGSSAWTDVSGYEPWELAGKPFGQLLIQSRADEVLNGMQRMTALLTSRDDRREDVSEPTLIFAVPVHSREGAKIPALLVILPVTIRGSFMSSEKLSFLAFSFSLSHEGSDLTSTAVAFQRQRPFFLRSVFGDLRACKQFGAASPLQVRDWRHLPLGNDVFVLALESLCYHLLEQGFVVSEMGIDADCHATPKIITALFNRQAELQKLLHARLDAGDPEAPRGSMSHADSANIAKVTSLGDACYPPHPTDFLPQASIVNCGETKAPSRSAVTEVSIVEQDRLKEVTKIRQLKRAPPAEKEKRSIWHDLGFRWKENREGKQGAGTGKARKRASRHREPRPAISLQQTTTT